LLGQVMAQAQTDPSAQAAYRGVSPIRGRLLDRIG
jgi:hypothetical protein